MLTFITYIAILMTGVVSAAAIYLALIKVQLI